MAIKQQGLAVADGKSIQGLLDCAMIRRMRLVDPPLQVDPRQHAMPQPAMTRRPVGNDAEPGLGAKCRIGAKWPGHDGRVDIIRRTVAVQGCTRGTRDDRSMPGGNRTPDQTIDQRIGKRLERRVTAGRQCQQPVRIIPTRMRHRKRDRKGRPMRQDVGGKESSAIQDPSLAVPFKDSKNPGDGPAGKSRAFDA